MKGADLRFEIVDMVDVVDIVDMVDGDGDWVVV